MITFWNKTAYIAIIILGFSSCVEENTPHKENVIVKGSDTMVNLTLNWAEAYMKKNPNISIQVTGGGSGNGIASILNNTADVANISRDLKEREIAKAIELGVEPKLYKVALDGIALIVHPSNNIDTLSLAEIRDIFSGKITNWSEIGGDDLTIVLYGRGNSSGTYEFFKEVIFGNEAGNREYYFSPNTQMLQGTSSLAEAIALDVRGIGYGGIGYFAKRDDLKIISLEVGATGSVSSPMINGQLNYDVIRSGDYPLSRYLYCLTNGEPAGAVKNYIEYITSSEGQKIVEEMEYISLPDSLAK